MKPSLAFPVSVLVLTLSAGAFAAETDSLAQLNQALEAGVAFTYGKDAQPLRSIEQIVVAAAANPAQRPAVEARLLAALAGPATRDAKEFLCRQLFIVGTARCVPALEALLTDPALAHVARFVLGRLEGPEAPAALLRAMPNTSGELQIGIVSTLGEQRCADAATDLIRLLGASDAGVAAAAATALGKIGGDQSASALAAARTGAVGPLAFWIDDALLACADSFHAAGKNAQALDIYRAFYAPSRPGSQRVAALRGLLAAGSPDATALLIEAIRSSDHAFAACAIGFARTAVGGDVTQALTDLLPTLPPELQELLLNALGGRADRAAQEAVLASIDSPNAAVRLAALEALGTVGDGSVVPPLLRVAASGATSEAAVARASLARLQPAEADTVLIQALGTGEPKYRIEACRALAKRQAMSAIAPLLGLARDGDATVRAAAIPALGALVGATDLPSLVGLLVRPHTPEDRLPLEAAIETAFRRITPPEEQAGPVLAALETAPADARPALLRLLGLAATTRALDAVRTSLNDPDPAVREAAIRTLADWPDERPAEELLALAPSLSTPALKAVALRGYVRMAGLARNPTAMYARALATIQRPEDKRLVLSGLGTAGSADALALVEQCLADDVLRAEAGLAAVQIADRLRQRDEARARETLKRVLAGVQNPAVRQKAQDLLNEVDRLLDHIVDWVGVGPFKADGLDTAALVARPFPPEQTSAQNVAWKRLTDGVGPWSVSLDAAIGGGDDLVAYARTRVWAPAAQDVRLELGSDDAIKVWLNGAAVHTNVVHRGVGPRQDQVKASLREGWNDLLLKIVNRGGGWGFACRIRQPDGSALDALKTEAR